jgi:hypothetical protein
VKKEGNKPPVMKGNSVEAPVVDETVQGTSSNAKASGVRAASKEQFEKAQQKTSKLHAGLFRRLAK